jgi:thiamine-phosphate diphosphorylase
VIPRLHVVTDDEILAGGDFLDRARLVLEFGADVAFHLRGPRTDGRRLFELAVQLREIAAASGAKLLVNDRVDVAMCAGVYGVHVGGRSLAPREARRLLGSAGLLGVSVHTLEAPVEAPVDASREASREQADFLFLGSIWPTTSHPGRAPAGPGLVQDVSAAAGIPVLGIGGVTPGRVPTLLQAGAHGVAVIDGIWRVPSSGDAMRAYLQALSK